MASKEADYMRRRRTEGKALDRIDPNGNYGPNNCRWATTLEQRHNRRGER